MRRRTFLRATLAAVSVTLSAATLSLRAAAAQVVTALRPRPRGMRLPPIPKWNKVTDDIDGQDYMRRCGDYERSLLPADMVFPRAGQIWEAVRDCEVHFMAWPPYPFHLSVGRARLQQGERVRILEQNDPKPLAVRFQPVRYDELQERIVPEAVRSRPGYTHYELSLRTAQTVCYWSKWSKEPGYFRERFRLVEDVG